PASTRSGKTSMNPSSMAAPCIRSDAGSGSANASTRTPTATTDLNRSRIAAARTGITGAGVLQERGAYDQPILVKPAAALAGALVVVTAAGLPSLLRSTSRARDALVAPAEARGA